MVSMAFWLIYYAGSRAGQWGVPVWLSEPFELMWFELISSASGKTDILNILAMGFSCMILLVLFSAGTGVLFLVWRLIRLSLSWFQPG